ncbi:cupin domain-containing protein [Qaidamihabitans albus]|uniref:cupin domain-containing protein n=1 Tax=Qaidamihabitans albus TaxID=2795733 RepID=UPI0018F18063|nr:cupin domain-containing protein [Qaidamihabitans albus]
MGLVTFDERDADNLVAGHYSTGRGQVLRSDMMELTKIRFDAGKGAEMHQHPEEQILYVLDGVFEVTLGEQVYEVRPGQASYHPSNVPHRAVAKEATTALSFKLLVDPNYDKTGELV